jgi:hypothetical protein
MAVGELTPRGPAFWLDNIMWIWIFSIFFVVPPVVGYKSYRHTWAICWLWVGGLIIALAYLPTLVLTAAVASGWLKPGYPNDVPFFKYWAFGMMLVCMPLYYFIYRMLTMRYFQPWTTPDQWEKEAYKPPAWANAIIRNSAYLILLILILRGCAAMMGGHGR